MQSSTVMAFRKRLKSRGYTDICIKRAEKHSDINYTVTAVEPLTRAVVSCEYDLGAMHRFR